MSIDVNERARLQRYEELAEHEHTQARAIADHYASLAALACELRELILRKQYGGSDIGSYIAGQALDQLIWRQVDLIKDAHRRDLGLALEWTKPTTS